MKRIAAFSLFFQLSVLVLPWPAMAADRFLLPCQLYLQTGEIEIAEQAALARCDASEDAIAGLAQFWAQAADQSAIMLRELKPLAASLGPGPSPVAEGQVVVRTLQFADTHIPLWRLQSASPAEPLAAALLSAYFAVQSGGSATDQFAAARARLRQAAGADNAVIERVEAHLARWEADLAMARQGRGQATLRERTGTQQQVTALLLRADGFVNDWAGGQVVYATARRFRPGLALRPEQYHYALSDYLDTVMFNAFPACNQPDRVAAQIDRRDASNCLAAILGRLAQDERALAELDGRLGAALAQYQALADQAAGGLQPVATGPEPYRAAAARTGGRWRAVTQELRQRVGDWQAWLAGLQ